MRLLFHKYKIKFFPDGFYATILAEDQQIFSPHFS
jgi:hypothetical protein